jgi:hypothetical protein
VRASGTLEQRLRAHVTPTIRLREGDARFYAIVEPPDPIIVEERALPGEARVECRLPDGWRCVTWNPSQPDELELSRPRRQQLDWENDELSVEGFDGRFQHRKVELNEDTGAGALDL